MLFLRISLIKIFKNFFIIFFYYFFFAILGDGNEEKAPRHQKK